MTQAQQALERSVRCAAGRGYLANVDPSRYYRDFDHALPDSMTGQDFLAEYGTHVDAATTVEPAVR